jgi:tetratricopeptide (TPR) repeat protein
VKGWAEGALQRRFEVALETIDGALEHDPTYAKAHVYRSWILRSAGRVEACVSAAQAAYQIDPHSLLIRHAMSWALFCARRVKEALRIEKAILKIDRDDVVAGAYAGIYLAYMGRHQDGVATCRHAYELSNQNPAVATALSYALAEAGVRDEARSLAEVTMQRKRPYTLRPHLAMTYASLGDRESAVRLLLEAHKSGCPWAPCALIDPRLGLLASDPRLACLRDQRPSEP